MKSIVFLSHREEQCGVHQFGKQIFAAISNSSRFDFVYCEVAHPNEVRNAVLKYDPAAILVNFHPLTIGWIVGSPLWHLQVPTIGIRHEMTAEMADRTDDTHFDYYILHDPSARPSNALCFTAGRLISNAPKMVAPPSRLTIGSFGFATPGKGFEAVVARAHAEFDDCLIRLNIPSSDFCDKDGSEAHRVAERCSSMICKPGIDIEVTHDFMDLEDVKGFLAGNSLNAFFYDEQSERGISSAVDLALAARRPIALRRTSMVRHLFDAKPSIFIEDRSLREIVESGLTPLEPYIDRWSAENIRANYEGLIDSVLVREAEQSSHSRWYRLAAKLEAEKAATLEKDLAGLKRREVSLEEALQEERAQTTNLRSTLQVEQAETANLRNALQVEQAETANLRSALQGAPYR
jgi:hypothetical protein